MRASITLASTQTAVLFVHAYTSACINHSRQHSNIRTCACIYIRCSCTHAQVLRICACSSASQMLLACIYMKKVRGAPELMMHAKCICMRVNKCSCIHDLSMQYQHHRSTYVSKAAYACFCMHENLHACVYANLHTPMLILSMSASQKHAYAFVCMRICTHQC
jgi:hypothetical protein